MIKQIQKGREEFEKKFKKYDKDGGFIVYVPGYDNNDFDVESIVEEFTQQQTALLLEVKHWAEERREKAQKAFEEYFKLAPNSYGTGLEFGELQTLQNLITYLDKSIKEI